MFDTIVAGVDGREGGRDALRLAAELAGIGGGRLVAARVFPYGYPVRGAPAVPDEVLERPLRDELAREIAAERIEAEPLAIGDASPARGLHRVAEHVGADLIVVGSTHRGPLGRAVVGDDALATIHDSPCPVVVAPRGGATLGERGPAHIAVGYDGEAESRHAVALAARLAKSTGAALEIVAVVETPIAISPTAVEPSWLTRRRKAAKDLLHEAVQSLDMNVDAATPMGEPDEVLAGVSQRVDLLVVGSRAFGRLGRLAPGSTAARVVHATGCPVIVMPRGAEVAPAGGDEADTERIASP